MAPRLQDFRKQDMSFCGTTKIVIFWVSRRHLAGLKLSFCDPNDVILRVNRYLFEGYVILWDHFVVLKMSFCGIKKVDFMAPKTNNFEKRCCFVCLLKLTFGGSVDTILRV